MAGTVATKTEAEDALSRVRTDVGRGQFTVTEKTTLEDYLRAWHEVKKKWNEPTGPDQAARHFASVSP